MKKILILIILSLTLSFTYSQSCDYTLRFYDSYGDGWGETYDWWTGDIIQPNAYQNIDINGRDFGDLYISDGSFSELTISLNQDDVLEITYTITSSTWEYENSFELIDCLGNIVWSGGGDGNNHYYSDTIDCHKCTLPVEFLKSDYNCSSNQLTWTTASETNNDYYTIKIGTIYNHGTLIIDEEFTLNGNGNSNTLLEYNLPLILTDTTYIEIWQTDFDGTTVKCGNTLVANCDIDDDLIVSLFPNPSQGDVEIIGEVNQVEIYNMIGQKIQATIINNQIIGLSTGYYIVVVNNHYKIKLIIS